MVLVDAYVLLLSSLLSIGLWPMEAASWTRNLANFQIAEINWRPADFGLRSREGEAVPLVCREMELSRVGFVTKPLSGQR